MIIGIKETTKRSYVERVLRVLVFIQQNLDSELSLADLAPIANFSPFHFHRIFQGLVGESVKQHVRRLRLERAARHLKLTRRSIVSIALEAGYEAHESFTRAFRANFGCAPREFRSATNRETRIESASHVHLADTVEQIRFAPLQVDHSRLDVRMRVLEPRRFAFVRHQGLYSDVGATWEILIDWVGRECIFGPNTLYFGLCWDDPDVTPPEKCRYDSCVTVDDSIEPAGEIGVATLPGGRYAVALHEGPYDRFRETYVSLLGGWFPSQGFEPGEPPGLESYLNDPDSTDPEDLLTEIMMPIRGGPKLVPSPTEGPR